MMSVLVAGGVAAASPRGLAHSTERPDVIVVMVDDLAAIDNRILDRLPNIKALFVDSGLSFDNFYGEEPLCCPARATFLTGQHVRHHHVVRNDARLLDPSHTVATALHDAGYWTVLTGKYLNHSELLADRTPPGWDRVAMLMGTDKTYALSPETSVWNVDDQPEMLDTYRDRANIEFSVAEVASAPTDQPLFLWTNPRAPHWGTNIRFPWRPAVEPKFVNDPRCSNIDPWLPPSYDYDRQPGGFPLDNICRSMLTVDDEVGELETALAARKRDTVWVLTSDNGMSWGEHGLPLKANPWATQAPLFFAGPGIAAGATTALESQIDLAPTIAALGGATMPWADGRSFAAVLFGQSKGRRWMIEDQPVAHYTGGWFRHSWRAIRTPRWHWIHFDSTNYLYDLATDPWELHNVVGEHPYVLSRLRSLYWRARH